MMHFLPIHVLLNHSLYWTQCLFIYYMTTIAILSPHNQHIKLLLFDIVSSDKSGVVLFSWSHLIEDEDNLIIDNMCS